MQEGLITKSTGSWYQILYNTNKIIDARIKGKFRTEGVRNTNPIAVGDKVNFTVEEDKTAVIHKIHSRKNYIIRKSVNLSKKGQIIAANIDQAFLVITVKQPKTTFGFVDRFLATAEAYGIPVILLFNKIDLLTGDESLLESWEKIYNTVGYRSYRISAKNDSDVDFLKDLMKDKKSLISGHSGVGKSTLINRLNPNLKLRTQQISEQHLKGQHTTTFAEMFPIGENEFIIDTPGIKGFGLLDMEKEEISHYFKEFVEKMHDCKFNNCVHITEPACAVKEALKIGQIAESRYKSYLSIYNDDDTETYRTNNYEEF